MVGKSLLLSLGLPLAGAAIIGGSAYGFMANNAGTVTGAGSGSQDISGYVVSNVNYTTGTTGQHIQSVSFDLTPANSQAGPASTVHAWFSGYMGANSGGIPDATNVSAPASPDNTAAEISSSSACQTQVCNPGPGQFKVEEGIMPTGV
ncbi:MAG: hypothetical protein OWS74_05370, partial [Firmicutes bacterium]|nr:hypothetical protein [Bacillota bacterium]